MKLLNTCRRFRFAASVALLGVLSPGYLLAQEKPATAPTTKPAAVERVSRFTAKHPDTNEELVCLVDVTAAPELEAWGADAGKYALKWYPVIEKALATEGYKPTREFRLLFKPMDGVPAYASGNVITINAGYVKKNKDDWGMVAHELSHVIQRYRRAEGWLTEGISDYIRYYVVEPGSKRARFDINKTTYKNAYQPAAGMLNWLETTKGPGIVAKLNAALRAGKYNADAFKTITGGTPDEMWEAFKASKTEKEKK